MQEPSFAKSEREEKDMNEKEQMETQKLVRLDTVRIESARYEKICKGLKVAEQAALRNRYTLDIYKQTNELFHYPVKLLEVLEVYDSTKNDEERLQALVRIGDVCNSFKSMRAEFEKTYSQTRFMESPSRFIS